MWKWINSWQVTVLISLWQTHAETVKLWYNRSISKVQTKCLSQLKNMGKSTDCLQFQHLHVYKNQSWVCKDQWLCLSTSLKRCMPDCSTTFELAIITDQKVSVEMIFWHLYLETVEAARGPLLWKNDAFSILSLNPSWAIVESSLKSRDSLESIPDI